jgi:alpha-ribazole phosphatase
MKRWDDIDPTQLQRWMDDYVNVPCAGGESYQVLAERVSLFFAGLRSNKFPRVAIVTHHGVIKAIHAQLKQISLIAAMETHFQYGSISVYNFKI